MTNDADRRWRETLQAWLDDELTPAERAVFESEIEAHPERVREARELERLARRARSARVSAPAGFSDRVMAGIAATEPTPEPPARRYVPPPEPGFFARLFGAGAGGFRPGLAGAVALAALAVAITLLVSRLQAPSIPGGGREPLAGTSAAEDTTSGAEVVVHRFVLEAPTAQTVCLVGDFNEWKLCEVPMRKDATTGQWIAEVKLPKGRHQYMFVVDDQEWQTDPRADVRVDDGFGNKNAVVFL